MLALRIVFGDAEIYTANYASYTQSIVEQTFCCRAYQLDNDKYEYEFKVVAMKMNVREIEKTLNSAKRSPEILTIISNVAVLRECDLDDLQHAF